MNASSGNLRSRLDTFEILRIILDAVDRGLVPAGTTGRPSLHQVWAGMTRSIERKRLEYAWEFVRDEELVVIGPGERGFSKLWRMSKEGRILLGELRRGAFSSLNNVRQKAKPGRP